MHTKKPAPDKIKERLYPSVLSLFSKNDFHRVTMRDISRFSGVSSGTIYKYFDSKETLILTILEEYIEEIHRSARLHIQGIESTREKFHKIFWVVMDFYDQNPGLAVTYFITVPTRTWMQRGSYLRYDTHQLFTSIIEEGKRKKEIDPKISGTQITSLFFLYCQRAVTTWYRNGMEWKLADSIERFFPVFWKTLAPV
jgi:AcrR family transcriptional regulator